MKSIRVSDAVWAMLQQNARPFEDSPNDVIERMLKIRTEEIPATPKRATTRSGRTTQQAFRQPIIDALRGLGGKAHKADVMAELEKSMTFTKEDLETDGNGRLVWRERAAWEAVSMRRDGVLLSPKHGIWEVK